MKHILLALLLLPSTLHADPTRDVEFNCAYSPPPVVEVFGDKQRIADVRQIMKQRWFKQQVAIEQQVFLAINNPGVPTPHGYGAIVKLGLFPPYSDHADFYYVGMSLRGLYKDDLAALTFNGNIARISFLISYSNGGVIDYFEPLASCRIVPK